MVASSPTKPQNAAGLFAGFIWLGIQLAAITLAAIRIRLWATAPQASEQLALAFLLVAQTAGACLLFPVLLDSTRAALSALITAWPMAELAAFLADVPPAKLLPAEICVSLWLVTLSVWSRLLRSSAQKTTAAAVMGMLTLGGPLLCYLQADFAGQMLDWPKAAWLGPTNGVLSQIFSPIPTPAAWIVPATLCIAGILYAAKHRTSEKNPRC